MLLFSSFFYVYACKDVLCFFSCSTVQNIYKTNYHQLYFRVSYIELNIYSPLGEQKLNSEIGWNSSDFLFFCQKVTRTAYKKISNIFPAVPFFASLLKAMIFMLFFSAIEFNGLSP